MKTNNNEITAQDLRLGNYVQFGTLRRKVILIQSQSVLFGTEDNNFSVPYSELKPIPLTKEIMQKCGFIQVTDSKWLHKDLERLQAVVYVGRILNGIFGKKKNCLDICCVYLHVLQNYFFDLTGEELNVKL